MRTLAQIIAGLGLGLGAVVVLLVAIACFMEGFKSYPQRDGSYTIAGAILVGSGMIAIAIAGTNRHPDN